MSGKRDQQRKSGVHSWQDIARENRPAPGGSRIPRWRRVVRWVQRLMVFGLLAAIGLVGWFGWQELGLLGEEAPYSREMVRFETNEELTQEWFLEYTGLRGGARLGIFEIKEKLSDLGQIEQVTIERRPGGVLLVKVRERTPVLRLAGMLPSGERVVRVVAPDGVVYKGINYGQLVYFNLPELRDAAPRPTPDGRFDMIPGMEVLGPMVLMVRQQQPELYQTWESISVRDFQRGDVDAPGAVIRIRLRQGMANPGEPQIREVVFSGKDWLAEYREYYANTRWMNAALAQVRERIRGNNLLFDLYLSLENKTDPHRPFKEPRLIPVPMAD